MDLLFESQFKWNSDQHLNMLKEKCNRVKPTPDDSSRGGVSEEENNSSSSSSEEGSENSKSAEEEGSEDSSSVEAETANSVNVEGEEEEEVETDNSVNAEGMRCDVCGNTKKETLIRRPLKDTKILQEKPLRGETIITSTSLTCTNCRKIFTRRDNCRRHTKTCAPTTKK
jgi:hypothetical protein